VDAKTKTQAILVNVLTGLSFIASFFPKGKAAVNLLLVLVTEHWDTIWSLVGGQSQLVRQLSDVRAVSPGTAHTRDAIDIAIAFQERQMKALFSDEARAHKAVKDQQGQARKAAGKK
jgi:hypothetical protein